MGSSWWWWVWVAPVTAAESRHVDAGASHHHASMITSIGWAELSELNSVCIDTSSV